MARGRLRLEWDQTSLVWWTIAESNRDKDSEPLDPLMFHPLHARPQDIGEPNWGLWSKIANSVEMKPLDLSKLNGKQT